MTDDRDIDLPLTPPQWRALQPAAPLPPLGSRPLPDLAPLSPEGKRRRRSLIGWLLWSLVRLVFWFVLVSLLWVTALKFVPVPITATMIGDIVAGHGATRYWRTLDHIDVNMPRAVIAGEDAQFCTHHGFDYEAIRKAWEHNEDGKRIHGGSTISQQTAKNVFLWQGGGFFRKGLEAWFTVLIETIWGKKRIMQVYLNVAETGIGTYGVEAGARRYFKHGADRLSAREAAQIAAVLPLPKKRAAIDPRGFTRRYGNAIAARIGVVRRDRLDACLF